MLIPLVATGFPASYKSILSKKIQECGAIKKLSYF